MPAVLLSVHPFFPFWLGVFRVFPCRVGFPKEHQGHEWGARLPEALLGQGLSEEADQARKRHPTFHRMLGRQLLRVAFCGVAGF